MAAPVAVVDMLGSLLDAQLNSVFRFMGEGSPYLSRATADVRRPLAQMVEAERRRAQDLADAIEAFGATPEPGVIRGEEQYLAYLSLKFLLPKLVHEKQLQIQRYENALAAVPKGAPDIKALLDAHLQEMRQELSTLEKASAQVVAAAKSAAAEAK